MEPYLLLKWLHVVSSTVLFGFGAGTAWYLWNAHLTGDAALIAKVGRMVVRADWIFTGTSGVVQPASGQMLIHLAGHSLTEPWLVVTYGLYALAFACWVPVVWLQMKAQRFAQIAADTGAPLRSDYLRTIAVVCPGLACIPGSDGRFLAHDCQARPLANSTDKADMGRRSLRAP